MGKEKNFGTKRNTNGLKQNPQNRNTQGRPRKLVSDVLTEMKLKGIKPVSIDEIKDIYLSLVNNTQEDLQEIVNDTNQPMITKIIIQAIVRKGKGFEVIERMFDRAIGKAIQKQEHS